MKKIIFILITIINSSIAVGQIRQLEPSIFNYPDLDPDTLSKYQALSDEYNQILLDEIPYHSLTSRQKTLFENELLHSEGPYFTGELGCSWYCAVGPLSVTSTSQLDSTQIINYKPENAHDFDLRTAWVEGREDFGIGEKIEFEFKLSSHLKLTHIDIFNGYSKNEKAWKENSRVKVFSLYINDNLFGYLNLEDTFKGQRFDLGSLGGDENEKLVLTLRIIEVYKGEKYMDTVISEINFDGTGDH
ncbi:NADase-type glycan-binding domain-containing protein [Brumimicrobium mesophilum]|uniref:NADase-type glycan-binding domain-containing protein n=1 Tax=Brumimicrobium mesophilum TaxID=392717 RepID=UPI000D142DAA|nr:hypothetical protein [Brumimicrobium mesophilum]